ncbi:hypothetical protein [Gangjinia marincola]
MKRNTELKDQLHAIKSDLKTAKTENMQLTQKMSDITNENQTLKTANALLGSNDHTKETKLKINRLIREIDQCIIQLAE